MKHISQHIKQKSQNREYTSLVQYLYSQLHLLEPKDARSVQLAQWWINFSQKFTQEFTDSFGQAKSKSLEARKLAKENNDRAYFVPYLQTSLDLAKQYARIYDPYMDPYNVWLDGGHTWMNKEQYQKMFEPIIDASKHILNNTDISPQNMDLHITEYDQSALYALILELIQNIWYDLTQWTFNIIKRPYSENCGPGDERIHIWADKPLLESILAALHECGHGLTDMFINPSYHWTNLHRTTPMWIHESQSRTLENFVWRSKPFCVYLETLLEKYFPDHAPRDAQQIYAYLNHISPEIIRTNADEVTYNIHIYIRFLIEQELFDGSLPLMWVPDRRNELYYTHLSVMPDNNKEWCLQDQHRALWLFGYFPAYTIWNMVAAQMREVFRMQNQNWWNALMEGDFSQYFARYQHAVWWHGNMYHPTSLVQNITWNVIGPDALVKYLNEKYLSIPRSPHPTEDMTQERALNEALIQERTELKSQVKKVIGDYKNTFDSYHKEIHSDLSYIPTSIQIASQESITDISQQENAGNQKLQ